MRVACGVGGGGGGGGTGGSSFRQVKSSHTCSECLVRPISPYPPTSSRYLMLGGEDGGIELPW